MVAPDVNRQQFSAIELWAAPELTAERTNRLTLTEQRDWLGRKHIKLDWRWSQCDRDNVERSAGMLSSQIEAAGLGSVRRLFDFDGPPARALPGYTTRWVVPACMPTRNWASSMRTASFMVSRTSMLR